MAETTDHDLRETIKELAQLDGAIVVSESAVVRVFEDGRITGEGLPELWLPEHHGRSDCNLHRPGRS